MVKINLSGLSLQDLQVLVEVSRAGSVSAASENLGISQPSASYSLDKSRHAFRDKLFVRAGHKMKVTPYCEELVAYLDKMLLNMNRIAARDAFRPEVATNVFRVVGALYECRRPEGWFVPSLLSVAPNVGLQASAVRIPDVDARLGRDFDLYFGPSIKPAKGIHTYSLGESEIVIYYDGSVAPAPHDLESFLHRDYVRALELDSWSGIVDEHLASTWGVSRRFRFGFTSIDELARSLRGTSNLLTVSAGISWSVLDEFDCAPLPFTVRPMRHELRWSERLDKDPAHVWFRQFVIDFLKDRPKTHDQVMAYKKTNQRNRVTPNYAGATTLAPVS